MLSIPLPFVVSMMLLVLAGSLMMRRAERMPLAAYFLMMCAATTAIVGLRWLLDWAILRTLQPIFACAIPVLAWYVFARAQHGQRLAWWHVIAPSLIVVSSLTYRWWSPPLDLMLTSMYVVYGVALWYTARYRHAIPENVPLSDVPNAAIATRMGGSMLLFSALIDGALSLDFMFWEGAHATLILTIGHALLLPILALVVIWMSLHTQEPAQSHPSQTTAEPPIETIEDHAPVMATVQEVIQTQQLYLDPDLTLAKLARKAGIPTRIISNAVNQTHHMNVSQWVNRYRIDHARQLLRETDQPITEVYLASGFQTKSNFHRAFSQQVGKTPSDYRKNPEV
ncbi:AraC family transcriptional regulator [Marinomonas piezotolerans]|uniref:AraC family transcriptional regulator n=1 Tax=Marinomonas piezotolerans TaxID=2213058 RepID=A0A370UBM7_9GAMM|nr:AraC family transcriptional regulator [Marinomonas piezotolerans]RDL45141.1 AraC family transcriptional regulator [Marinomonas piezotolerans]